ncbi:MAG: protein-tyrosine kinase, partial [Solirubrobacterales bacterium]|nr:protein-tyrosine kinase [Solirubrobacterales bacterium]
RPGPARLTQPDFETFRELQARLDAVVPFRVPRSLVVTSALPAEGKSAAAAGIAIAAAAAGRRTLLVECDLHRPVLASRLGLAARPGLTDYLAGQVGPQEVVQPVRLVPPAALSTGLASVGLSCLVAGGGSARPAELLGSQRFRAFLDQVSRAYDLVVCDGPPILEQAGADQLLEAVEAALLCVRLGQTTHEQAAIAKAEIDRAGVEIAGLLVTGGRL